MRSRLGCQWFLVRARRVAPEVPPAWRSFLFVTLLAYRDYGRELYHTVYDERRDTHTVIVEIGRVLTARILMPSSTDEVFTTEIKAREIA